MKLDQAYFSFELYTGTWVLYLIAASRGGVLIRYQVT